MRLVELAGYSGPYGGSFVPMMKALALEARGRGWDVLAGLPAASAEFAWIADLKDAGIPVRFAPGGGRDAHRRWIGELLAEGGGPAVLHSHFTTFDVAAARAGAERVFWHIHSPQHAQLSIRLRNAVKYGIVGRRTTGILCVSPDITADIIRRGGPRDRTRFVPNAIDTARHPLAAAAAREQARELLGIEPGVPLILHLGWDWERKGGDRFLAALASLRAADHPDAIGVTVGAGATATTSAAAAGLAGAVRVVEPRPDPSGLYAAADVLLVPSRAEGMPFAIVEALCAGTGVVSTPLAGPLEIGRDLAALRFAEPDGPSLAAAIAELLDRSPEQAARDGEAARSRMVERFDLRGWATRLIDDFAAT